MGSPARPLPLREDATTVDVSLVEAAHVPETPGAPEPPAPEPTPVVPPIAAPPEPVMTPEPSPTPAVEPAPPAAEMSASSTAPATPVPEPRRTVSSRPAPAKKTSGSHGISGLPTTARPRYRSNPTPEYPAEARRLGQQGLVLIGVEVGADGHAHGLTLKRSSGYRLLDDAAMQAVRRWLFEPARTGGLPVASRADVPVKFSLAE